MVDLIFHAINRFPSESAIDFANNVLKVDNFGFSVARGNPKTKETIIVSPEKYLDMTNRVSQHYRKKARKSIIPIRSLFLANRDLVYKYTYKTLVENRYQMECYAGKLRGVILENGDVYPCEVLMEQDKKYLIGNLRDYDMDFSKLWNSGKRKQITSQIKTQRCFCTHGCDMTINTFFGPKFTLKLVTKLFSHYLKI